MASCGSWSVTPAIWRLNCSCCSWGSIVSRSSKWSEPVSRVQSTSSLFRLLEVGRFASFPHYQTSLPQHTDLTGKKVYLIHLNTPYKHAKHYLGFSEDVQRRVWAVPPGGSRSARISLVNTSTSWLLPSASRIFTYDPT